MSIVKDSFLQYNPKITLILNKKIKKNNAFSNKLHGTLLGMHTISTQDSSSDRKYHTFHLHIRFDESF